MKKIIVIMAVLLASPVCFAAAKKDAKVKSQKAFSAYFKKANSNAKKSKVKK